jgi:uncharacterized protein (TIGR02118 family)
MIKLSILYPNNEGGRFDMDYYVNIHIPMSIEKLAPALRGVSVDQGLDVPEIPGKQPTYVAAAHMLFDSIAAFQETFGPHSARLQGDMINYTDIEPVYQFSEVRIAQ